MAAVVPSQAQAFDPDQRIRNYFATLSTLNFERYIKLYTPDGVLEDPVGGPAYRGHKEGKIRSAEEFWSLADFLSQL